MPIQGVCNHHDLGCLGAAAYDRAIERQVEILKAMGCNAIRTSHNPPAPKLLELCDRMGMLVMDEAFDEWKDEQDRAAATAGSSTSGASATCVSMLRRDRNHPCVILWSIGNEIPEQGDPVNGRRLAKRLADICHAKTPRGPSPRPATIREAAVKDGFADAAGRVRHQLPHPVLRRLEGAAHVDRLGDRLDRQHARRVQPRARARPGCNRAPAEQPVHRLRRLTAPLGPSWPSCN